MWEPDITKKHSVFGSGCREKMYFAENKLLIAYMGFCGMPALLANLLFFIKELEAPSEVRIPLDKQI